jgi:LmbE family N-acetylglucosaminyl deacetylase
MEKLRLLAALAHPDDETLGLGGMLAHYSREGMETYLVTATRGEKGWFGPEEDYPGPEALGSLRETELRAAAAVLGIRETSLLDYIDGELDTVDPYETTRQIAESIRRIRPHVVVTMDPDGIYGHPDHIAMCQFVTAAVVLAASADASLRGEPHLTSKLYYRTATRAHLEAYQAVFGDLVMNVDGVERRGQGWSEWSITTRLDTATYWEQVWEAVQCHRSQLTEYEKLAGLPPEHHASLWGSQEYYRVFSTVNGGRTLEDDLFAGLREEIAAPAIAPEA